MLSTSFITEFLKDLMFFFKFWFYIMVWFIFFSKLININSFNNCTILIYSVLSRLLTSQENPVNTMA